MVPDSAKVDSVLAELAAELEAEGSVLSAHVRAPLAKPDLGSLAAAGPRAAADPPGYAAVVESVREGYLLHFGEPRIAAGLDPDLALLAGDYLYAKGLLRLSTLDDPEAVAELSDLISLSAQMHAGGDDPDTGPLWLACVTAIAVGGGDAHERAKRALRCSGDVSSLLEAARRSAAAAGLDERLAEASESVRFQLSTDG